MDLAEGHVAAIRYISRLQAASANEGQGYGKYSVFNLGTGRGYSGMVDLR
jgi:UDP-glucose 4-epimerase